MAGKSSYTEEIGTFIAEHYALGLPITDIAHALGIPEQTVYSWTYKVKDLQKKIAERRLNEAIQRLSKVSSEWLLERMYPHYRLSKDFNINATLTINPEELTDEELISVIAAYKQAEETGVNGSKRHYKARKKETKVETRGRKRKSILTQFDKNKDK